MADWTMQQFRETVEVMAKKAMEDEAFRNRCLSDATGAIKEASGRDVPEDVKIRFVEKGDADLVFVLPDLVSKKGELADKDLEKVAGGSKAVAECVFSLSISEIPSEVKECTLSYSISEIPGV